MSESYTENEEVFADIVISGRIFGSDGRARNGALAVKDGKYLAIGNCDEISRYIGLDTIMCGYKNKSVLACLYSQATGDNVHEMGAAYQPSGEYKIMSGNLTMKVGDQANLTVYDEKVDVYSELEQSESKVLTKIENGEIIYRRRNPGNRTCAGMAIGEPSGECYEKIKLHSNHLLDCYDVIIRINCVQIMSLR